MTNSFILRRDQLLPLLQTVNSVIDKRSLQPILGNLLLKLNDQELSITASNSQIELSATIKNIEKKEESVSVTLPGKKFIEICHSLPEDSSLELTLDKKKAQIKTNKTKFTLATLPAEQFPLIPYNPDHTEYNLPAHTLRTLIDGTVFAVAQNDVRYFLNGLLIEFSYDKLRAVATNGHLLALHEEVVEGLEAQTEQRAIIPKKAVIELQRLLSNEKDSVTVRLNKNHVVFILGDINLTAKLVDGVFPDYQQVIPERSEQVLKVNKEELKTALNRVSILANEKFKEVKLQLSSPTALRVLGKNPEQEEAEEEVQATYSGKEMEIGFNARYLLDLLNSIEQKEVELFFSSPESSCLVNPYQSNNSQYVIMPIRL